MQIDKLAFTGTRRGMTRAQMGKVFDIFWGRHPAELHHGMCIGADTQAHYLALALGIEPHKWPGPASRYSGECLGGTLHSSNSYLKRNRIIVDNTEELIATPMEFSPQDRGGAWYTWRYAKESGKPVWLVYPDGRLEE